MDYFIDKSNWPPGDWHNELDYDIFRYKGYDCMVIRSEDVGTLSGYVRVPKNSKFGHVDMYSKLDVHGSITYAQKIEDEFWIGFDTSHEPDDLIPIELVLKKQYSRELQEKTDYIRSMVGDPLRIHKIYKNMDFVINEIMYVIDQMGKKKKITRRMKVRKQRSLHLANPLIPFK